MMRCIRNILGSLSKPVHAKSYHGDWYIEIPRGEVPLTVRTETGEKFLFHYRLIKQNKLGIWKAQDQWLQKYTPIRSNVVQLRIDKK